VQNAHLPELNRSSTPAAHTVSYISFKKGWECRESKDRTIAFFLFVKRLRNKEPIAKRGYQNCFKQAARLFTGLQ
jgi:hypothetical protein